MKKVYEEPSVKKVEFEFNERIAASGCTPGHQGYEEMSMDSCQN